ncbi:myb-like protein X [Plutella xylostella]|uniref:myb-like protein X n=1 Tax=Plutella xylostella TaxID=51655 RepID=UPI0020330745|nr:myb-like protein X [Plutella xylostella]
MLSSTDLERLITAKKRQIQKEKTVLGLAPPEPIVLQNEKQTPAPIPSEASPKQVKFTQDCPLNKRHETTDAAAGEAAREDTDEGIPPDLERYIRRYIGLPVMLKTGEYSPNNPALRGAAPRHRDAFLGLGDYEQRSKTLRRLRQREYKEYLDQQARKKQEEKEQAERERREREERERDIERLQLERHSDIRTREKQNAFAESYESRKLHKEHKTQAERELSPRTVQTAERHINPAGCFIREHYEDRAGKSNRAKLMSDLTHTRAPSLLDADAIQMRNQKAEQEAAKRKQYYQQDLKNQIEEQQRIREERKAREKLLEQAEMRRLEEQLRMLRTAQDKEVKKNEDVTTAMKENAKQFENKRTTLQKEIETEQKSLFRAASQPSHIPKRTIYTSKSENTHKLPTFYSKAPENRIRPTFSTNIPDNSIFSPNYDVDKYLRTNLNPSTESLMFNGLSNYAKSEVSSKDLFKSNSEYSIKNQEVLGTRRFSFDPDFEDNSTVNSKTVVEKALVHNPPKDVRTYEPSFLRKDIKDLIVKERDLDETPIPVLRHSPKIIIDDDEVVTAAKTSEAMKKLENKWKIPAVKKNVLKSLPTNEGKNVSILTQLGSIRRQLQLEQLKLDKMLDKKSDV